jgi:hypothetical protein
MRASAGQVAALLAAFAFSCAVSVAAYVVLPGFERMFAPLGSQLTPSAHVLFSTYRWWPLLALLVALAWFMSSSPAHGARRALAVGLSGSAILLGFGWWALQQSCSSSSSKANHHCGAL